MDSAGVGCGVNFSNRLVEQKKEEPDEARECIVCREADCTLILIIDYALEGHRAAKEHSVDNPAKPRGSG